MPDLMLAMAIGSLIGLILLAIPGWVDWARDRRMQREMDAFDCYRWPKDDDDLV